MAKLTKAERQLEKEVSNLFRKHGSGIQFDIMDLGKIADAGKLAHNNNQNVEEAIIQAIKQYRKN